MKFIYFKVFPKTLFNPVNYCIVAFSLLLLSCKVHRSYGVNSPSPNASSATKFTFSKDSLIFLDPERSFRGVWVATVANIDWPKNPNDSFEKKKEDYQALLAFYKKLNFNAVIVQIRTAADAFYPTELAPWSRYLTGKEGMPPAQNQDPLAWLIEATHAQGMEFHAWINPYRATTSLDTKSLSLKHDFNKHPNWFIPYGSKYYYNPGIPEVTQHLINIVSEIVDKYPVDGIHLDDYFYPYKLEGEIFKDQKTFALYGKGKSLETWRRDNINQLIKGISLAIKSKKPWVSFGVSPFGVWKNKRTDPEGSDTRAGQTTYEDLYADPLLWMQEAWIDYVAPQLYWSMDYELASHKKLIDWWVSKKSNSHIYIGNGPYKTFNNADKAWNNPNEIALQLAYAKEKKNLEGHIFFSAKSFMNPAQSTLVKELKTEAFSNIALAPIIKSSNKEIFFNWTAKINRIQNEKLSIVSHGSEIQKLVLYSYNPATKIYESKAIVPVVRGIVNLPSGAYNFVKGLNRFGQLSQAIKITKE